MMPYDPSAPRLMMPAPLPMPTGTGGANPPPSFMSQAQGMAGQGVTNGIYAQPANQGELTRLAYQMAGAPPQPSIVPESVKAAPLTVMPDPMDILRGVSSGDGVGAVLGGANQLSSGYGKGSSLYDSLVGGGTSLAGAGSGALANGALADAGFGAGAAAPALDVGLGAGGLAAVGGTGTGALGAATFSEASPSAAAAIDAAAGGSAAGTGALAASGIAAALPIAAIGWAVADALNKSGDLKSAGTSSLLDGMVKKAGWTLKDPRTQTYQLPDGRLIRTGNEARAVSEALRNGDSNAQQLYEAWLATAKAPKG